MYIHSYDLKNAKFIVCFFFQNATSEEPSKAMVSKLENVKMLKILKDCNIPLKDVLALYDQKHVIEYTIDSIGASKIFELLQNTSENGHFTQEVEQFCSNNVALKDILKNHTTEDLRQALVEQKTLSRSDIIQNCLIPLIEAPKDIQTYLKSLSIVDFGDILIEKLPDDDTDQFLTKLSKAYSNGSKESVTVQLCKKDLLSSSDLVSCFKSCLTSKKEEEQTEIMVEMFKFISSKLNAETLLNLHVDFLQRIPSIFHLKDK